MLPENHRRTTVLIKVHKMLPIGPDCCSILCAEVPFSNTFVGYLTPEFQRRQFSVVLEVMPILEQDRVGDGTKAKIYGSSHLLKQRLENRPVFSNSGSTRQAAGVQGQAR